MSERGGVRSALTKSTASSWVQKYMSMPYSRHRRLESCSVGSHICHASFAATETGIVVKLRKVGRSGE